MVRHLPAKEAAHILRLSVQIALTPPYAQMMEWQTYQNQSLVSKGVRVQVPLCAPFASLTQLAEYETFNLGVAGSIPAGRITCCAQLNGQSARLWLWRLAVQVRSCNPRENIQVRLKEADCKSVGESIRWFKSIFSHQCFKTRLLQSRVFFFFWSYNMEYGMKPGLKLRRIIM